MLDSRTKLLFDETAKSPENNCLQCMGANCSPERFFVARSHVSVQTQVCETFRGCSVRASSMLNWSTDRTVAFWWINWKYTWNGKAIWDRTAAAQNGSAKLALRKFSALCFTFFPGFNAFCSNKTTFLMQTDDVRLDVTSCLRMLEVSLSVGQDRTYSTWFCSFAVSNWKSIPFAFKIHLLVQLFLVSNAIDLGRNSAPEHREFGPACLSGIAALKAHREQGPR